jgi:lambda family phage portal protein
MKEVPVNRITEQEANLDVPVWARKQLESSGEITALKGAYHGASTRRRNIKEFNPGSGDANSDSLADLPKLRERSRDSLRNNPIATGAINTNLTHIVGPGLKVQSRIDNTILKMPEAEAEEWQRKAEAEFRSWAESLDVDIARGMNFYGYQNLVCRSVLESGDIFVPFLFKKLATSNYGLRLQAIEADRISNPNDAIDTKQITGGVEKDPDGKPSKYHIRTRHPGADTNLRDERKWVAINAFSSTGRRNILHVYEKLRPMQTRGIPYLAPVLEMLHNLGKYSDAELQAAVIASYFTVFIETEAGNIGLAPFEPTAESGGTTSDKDYRLASGALLRLKKGEKITTANPGRPNSSFDAFVDAIFRQIGAALGLSHDVLIQSFNKSYSASRAALLLAWKMFSTRRAWLETYFCDPVYAAWMEEAVLRDRIVAPGFLEDPLIRMAYLGNIWTGPSHGQIDPTKETKAAQMRIDGLMSTIDQEVAALGGDFDQNMQQIRKEAKFKKELGIGTPQRSEVGGQRPEEEEEEDKETEKE